MRKRDSKRRWIARFFNGSFVPWQVVVELNLKKRLRPASYEVNRDGVRHDPNATWWVNPISMGRL